MQRGTIHQKMHRRHFALFKNQRGFHQATWRCQATLEHVIAQSVTRNYKYEDQTGFTVVKILSLAAIQFFRIFNSLFVLLGEMTDM